MRMKWLVAAAVALAAAGLGATTAPAQDIRVAVWGEDDVRINDVRAKIQGAGSFAAVDGVNIWTQGVPSLAEASAYDSILIFGGLNDWGSGTSVEAGNVLADYADAGGGVCVGTFCFYSSKLWAIKGRFDDSRYQVMVPVDSQSEGHLTLGTRHVPGHPLLAGVGSFDGGSSSYRNPITQLVAGSTRVADWSNGTALLAVKELPDMGRRVDLNFYPPSSDVLSDFWEVSTDGDVLLANAVRWAAVPEPATLAMLGLGALAMIRRRRK